MSFGIPAGRVGTDTAEVPARSRAHTRDGRAHGEPDRDQVLAGRVHTLSAWVEARALFIVAVGVVVVLSLAGIPSHFAQDGWLALIAGREIAVHGIPQHDLFTQMAYGVRWVDQQWLAQLLMYELERIGGMQLLTVLYVLITGAAFAGAITAARRLGGQDLHVLVAAVPGAFFYLVTAVSIRTQGFAYPLFVATVWLLAAEARSQTRHRRVYWVLPMLVVWANLHGSVTMGVGLAMLFGVTELGRGVRARGTGAHGLQGLQGLRDARAWAFLIASPLTLFATPYGTAMVHYYSVTLTNSQFGRLVSEWKPVTSVPVLAVPLAALILATAYIVFRSLRARSAAGAPAMASAESRVTAACTPTTAVRTPLFDALALAALAFGAVDAVRNITWFGLAVMILLPVAITHMKRDIPAPLRRARINRIFALTLIAVAALTTVFVLARPTSWFTSTYPTNSIPTLKAQIAKDPNVKIFADVRYADWLIWEDPRAFSGRIAYDTSLELLTTAQLNAIADPAAQPVAVKAPATKQMAAKQMAAKQAAGRTNLLAPYGLWLLYPVNRTLNREILKQPGVQTLVRDKQVIILTRRTGGHV